MLCICNANGDIIAVSPSSLHQGSIDANKIILLAPYPKNAVISVLVTLPNRLSLYPQLAEDTDPSPYNMAAIDLDLGLNNPNCVAMNAWSYTLAAPITQYSGTLTLQFLVTLPDGTTPTTSAVNLPISRGSAWISPTVTTEDKNTIAEYLAAYLAAAQTAALNADEARYNAEMWATGEGTEYTESGETTNPAVPGDPQYQKNAKYYAELAYDYAGNAAGSAQDAESEKDAAEQAKEAAVQAKEAAESAKNGAITAFNNATGSANEASSYATHAEEYAVEARGYAEKVGDGAASLEASIDGEYVLTLQLLDAKGEKMSSANIDLPLEESITNIAYNEANKALIFTLRNGKKTRVPLDAIVSGLATGAELKAGLAGKVDKLTAMLKLYGTNSRGEQTSYSIVDVTGNSTLAIMTQAAVTAAVTAAVNTLDAKITKNTEDIAKNSKAFADIGLVVVDGELNITFTEDISNE